MLRLIKALALKGRTDAQVFYGDAFAGLIIFLLAVIVFFSLSGNVSFSESRVLDALVGDAESISSSLMSTGTPFNWTPDSVSVIGVTDGSYRLNSTKVNMLMGMSYNLTNSLFGTNANYIIFFKDKDSNVLPFDKCAFTNTGIVVQNITPLLCENVTIAGSTNLLNVERLAFYQDQIIKLTVYVWV